MFSQVCVKNSVHVGCIPAFLWAELLGRAPPVQTPYLGRHPPEQTPLADNPRQTPPWVHTPSTMGYGQQAGGTHPTGTNSCLGNLFAKLVNSFYSGKIQVNFSVRFSVDLNVNCVVYGDVTIQMTIKLYHLLQQLT